jgi:hypothetical protein
MNAKKGQIEMSFGMIFSIILIIAVVAIGFYVIRYFMSLSTCTSIGLFYSGMQKDVNDAWGASDSRSIFSGNVPGSVKYVCFGNLTETASAGSNEMLQELRKQYAFSTRENIFLYPAGAGSCTPDLGSMNINHAATAYFFCVKTAEGKVQVTISKGSTSSVVIISPA